MADMTLVQEILRLKALPKTAARVGVECLKEEFTAGGHNDTGKTLKTFKADIISNESVFVGSDAKGAYYVQKGRGPSVPKKARALHWDATPKWNAAFAMYSRPVKPDDYIGRAARKIAQRLTEN